MQLRSSNELRTVTCANVFLVENYHVLLHCFPDFVRLNKSICVHKIYRPVSNFVQSILRRACGHITHIFYSEYINYIVCSMQLIRLFLFFPFEFLEKREKQVKNTGKPLYKKPEKTPPCKKRGTWRWPGTPHECPTCVLNVRRKKTKWW